MSNENPFELMSTKEVYKNTWITVHEDEGKYWG